MGNAVETVNCMEINERGTIILLCGMMIEDKQRVKRYPTLFFYSANIETTVAKMSNFELSEMEYGRPFKVKRMKGTDIFVVGCLRHFIVLKMINAKITLLQTVRGIHTNFLYDFVICRNLILSKARDEKYLKITYFGDNLTGAMPPKSFAPIRKQSVTERSTGKDRPFDPRRQVGTSFQKQEV